MLKMLPAAMAAWCMTGVAQAQTPQVPPPDTAAHTVIVPFDASKPLKDQPPEKFYLDYAVFQDLWSKAKEHRRPEEPEKDTGTGVAVNLAMHDVAVEDAALTVKSRFQMGSRGEWQSVSLPLAIAGNTTVDWTLNGRVASRKDGKVLLENPGTHELDAMVTVGLSRGWQEAALTIPAAAASLLRVSVPLTDGLPDFTPQRQTTLVSEEVRDGRRVFTFVLNTSQGGDLTLKRQAMRRSVDQAVAAVCDVRTDLTVRQKVEQVHARLDFTFPGAERSMFVVSMDEDVRPVGWNVSGMKEVVLRREHGRLLAEVRLLKPVRDAFTVSMVALRTRETVEGERKAPYVGAQASRVERVIQVFAPPALKIHVTSAGPERIAAATPLESGEPVVGAWRLRGDNTVAYTVSVAEDTASAEMEALAQVGVSKLEIMIAAKLQAGRLPLRETYLRLPQGYEVQSVQGAGLRDWQRDESGVFVQFDASVSREARFVLNAAMTRAPGEAAPSLPVVFFEGMAKQKARMSVAVNAAMDVRLQFDRAWRETDPASFQSVFTVSPPWVTKRALLWEPDAASAKQPPAAPTVTLLAQAPKFSTDTVLLVRSADEALAFSQQVGIAVEQGAVAGLKVRLPASAPEARVSGPDVRDVQVTTRGEAREYNVTFQGEILGTASVTLDWEQPPAAEAALPLVVVDGASRSRRFFILENNSSREVKAALTQVEKTVASAVPWLPEGLASTDLYQARSADAEMKLTFSNTQATAANAAIITLAEITTALRPNGERWETVVYSLANRSLQFLPVRLPKGAELVTVMVGDEMVRADWGTPATTAGAKVEPCHLVPLIQMRAGQLSQQVRLTYFVPAKKDGLMNAESMDDPELVGLSAERTLWNVWVPEGYELDEFDGNMEEVVEDVIEDEKVQQKLSDVLRLNRIVSMSSTSVYDAKEALGNATKALEEVTKYQESKKAKSYRSTSDSKPTTKGKAVGKEVDEEMRFKSNAQVEQQLRQQKELLDSNTGKLSKTGAGTLQLQVGQDRYQMDRPVGNNWNFNKDAAAGKSKEGKIMLQGANTVINDNVAVSNDFLVAKDAPPSPSKPAAPDAKKPVQGMKAAEAMSALSSNSTLNNARGAANFLQADGSSMVPADERSAGGTPGQPGVSRGTIVTRSGQMAVIPEAPAMPAGPAAAPADPFAPAAADPFAPARAGGTSPVPPPVNRPAEPGRYEMAVTPRKAEDVRSVEKNLQMGWSNYNLGNFDAANQSFQEVLRVDPYNRAARRGMEAAERQRAEYFDTARDHTRLRMLNEVNRGWEDPVPVVMTTPQLKPQGRVSLPVEVPLTGTVYHFRKLKDHATLELDIDKPLEPGRKTALWLLTVGALVLGGIAWVGRKQHPGTRPTA
ncbi:hypothetical protein DES53_101216 [Roseimicrobium gellanilyticum]|uniref:Uncharacterized protein n=2 Tax=Roseimicrobium gellanilyticum TaxID=748857 RepID=A0A366HUR1_9BACT|nr:hypothetical protein DES53_101216 [Roseimicrobium gellanilyticum]